MDMETLAILALGVAVLFALLFITLSTYRKVGPNQAMIVSGFGASPDGTNGFRILLGGGGIVLPLIQQAQYLSLETYSVKVKPKTPLVTKDNVHLAVAGVVQLKVPAEATVIARAAENLLGKSDSEIAQIGQDSLIGHLRAAIGKMTEAELRENLSGLAEQVSEKTAKDIAKMGLTVAAFSINDLTKVS